MVESFPPRDGKISVVRERERGECGREERGAWGGECV